MKATQSESFLGKATPLVLARLSSAALTFAIPLVLARMLSLEEFGTYKQWVLVAQTLYYVLPFGLAQSLYFFFPRGEFRRAYFAQTLSVLSLLGLLAVAGVAWGSPWISSYFHNPVFQEYRWPLALYVWGVMVSSPLEVAMTGEGRTRAAAGTYLLSDALRTVAMVLPVLLGWGLSGLMWGLSGVALLRATVALAWVWAAHGPLWKKGLLTEQWRYTLPFGAAVAIQVPQVYAHQFAVSGVVSPEQFAVYAVACFQLPLAHLLYTPVSEVLMVRVGELERAGRLGDVKNCFQQAVVRLGYAFIPLAAFSFVAAPELISTIFGAKFLEAVPLYRIGVGIMLLSCFPADGLLRALGHTRHIFKVTVWKAFLTLPLLFFAVRGFGMYGGMWVSLGMEVFAVSLLLRGIPRALEKQPLLTLLPWKELGKSALAACGAVVGVWVMRALTPGRLDFTQIDVLRRGFPLVVASVSFGTGYLLSLRLVGVNPLRVIRMQ